MSGIKFKLKIAQRPADAPAPQPANAGAQLGLPQPGQAAPFYNQAAAPSYPGVPPQGAGAPPRPVALADPSKRKRPDELTSPTGEQPAKRPQPSGAAGPPPTGATKFKLTIKKPSASGLSSMPSADTASMGIVPTSSAYRPAGTNNGHAILQVQSSAHGFAGQQAGALPLPGRQQYPAAAMPASNPLLTKAQQKAHVAEQKAQEKAQAKADKQAEKLAKQQAADNEQQLAAVMARTFGLPKIKLKVKSSTGPPAPMAAPPVPAGMAPPPIARSTPAAAPAPAPSAGGAVQRPVVKFKVKAPALIGQPPPISRPAPTTSAPYSSALDAAAAIQNMQNMLRDNAYDSPSAAQAGLKRGRPARGAAALPPRLPGARPAGVPRPMVIKRARVDREWDEEFDPVKERNQRARLDSAAAASVPAVSHTIQYFMEKVLEGVAKKDEPQGNVFKAPVTDEVAPNYSTIVKNPMCFDDMRTKLRDGVYTTWELFEADLALVFNNAQAYNAQGTFVHHHASYLRDVSVKYLVEAKKGNTNFRGVAAGITRKYISEWSRTHKTPAARPMAQPRPTSSVDLAEQAAVRLEARQTRIAAAAAGARERHHLAAPAPNYGRGHRQHANVSYAADLGTGPDRPVRGASGRAARGTGRQGSAVVRAVRAGDPDARRMAAVYVRRSEAEELRDTYYQAVPNTVAQATWRGLAGGATAEGADYAAGNFALRPLWPGALYPNLAAAVQAHTQGGASFQGSGLPQDAYARSLARFVRRCHPAVRRMLVNDRLAKCMAVEGLPDLPPTPTPTPTPAPGTSSAQIVIKPEAPSSDNGAQGQGSGAAQLPASLPGAPPAAPVQPALAGAAQRPPLQPASGSQQALTALATAAATPALQQQLQLLAAQGAQGRAGLPPQQAAQLAQLLLQQGLAPRAPSPSIPGVLNLSAAPHTNNTQPSASAPTSLPVASHATNPQLAATASAAPVQPAFAAATAVQPALQAQAQVAPQVHALLQQAAALQQQRQQTPPPSQQQQSTATGSANEATPGEDEVSGSPLPDLPPASPTED